MGKLTVKGIQSLTKPGRYGDGGTLFLCIAPGGSKSWVQRVTIDGKRRDIGLGGFPVVGLATARKRAFDNHVAIAEGRNPLGERRKIAIPSFREASQRTFEANRPRWRNEKHAKNWLQSLEKYAFPVFGDTAVNRIDRGEVLAVLTPIWTSRAETAQRLRQRIRTVLRWCEAHGFVEYNAAGEAIDGALPHNPTAKKHFRALPYQDVTAALETVESSKASMAAKWCFRFLVLTATRSGEARGATWSDIDLNTREWRIPANRMKGGVEHRVPLSEPALEVLERAQVLRDESDLVFPSPTKKGRSLSDMTLTKLLRDVGLAERTTVHGFRSSFRDWASEKTNAAHAVMELSLAHAVGSSVEQAYARSDLFDKRRTLMEQWASYLSATPGKVVRIG